MKLVKNIVYLISLVLLLSACQSADTTSKGKSKSLTAILNDVSDKYAVVGSIADSDEIKVDVEDTEKADKVKAYIRHQLKENDLDHYKITVQERNIEQVKKEDRWFKIESKALANLQNNKEYENVTMKKNDVELKKPVTFTLLAPISSADDSAEEYARQIKQNVNEFLQTKEIKEQSKGDAYKIVIYDQNNQVIS